MDKESFEFNDFYYEVQFKKNQEKEKIKINHKKQYPEKIYKYYSVSENSINALINSFFYASHPIELNDALDSSPFLWYTAQPLDFNLYERFYEKVLNEKKIKEIYDFDIHHNRCKTFIGTCWEALTNIYGIISMTGIESHPLMWPHYTNEKGFKLKFDTTKLQESLKRNIGDGALMGLFPINYSKILAPIDISVFRRMLIPFFYSVTIKDLAWKYENEWRFIYSKPQMGVPSRKMGLTNNRENYLGIPGNRFAFYDSNLVEEIMFGFNFFNGEDFSIKWNEDQTNFTISPKKNIKSVIKLLDYIHINLSDKIFYSGVKYEGALQNKAKLVRTKEQLNIEKISKRKYLFSRTNNFVTV